MTTAEVDVLIDHKMGDFFLSKLRDAREKLWIMSPWISPDFIDLLLEKKTAGVDVRVITTNDYVSGQKEALGKLIENHTRIVKPENTTQKNIGLALIVGGMLLAFFTKGLGLILSIVGLVLYLIGREKSETYWVSKLGENNLKILESNPYKMVHAKIYVADNTVVMGSANLTGNGTRRSIESMAVMQSAELATKVCEMMNGVPIELKLKEISYDSVGRDIQHVETKRNYSYRKNSFRRY